MPSFPARAANMAAFANSPLLASASFIASRVTETALSNAENCSTTLPCCIVANTAIINCSFVMPGVTAVLFIAFHNFEPPRPSATSLASSVSFAPAPVVSPDNSAVIDNKIENCVISEAEDIIAKRLSMYSSFVVDSVTRTESIIAIRSAGSSARPNAFNTLTIRSSLDFTVLISIARMTDKRSILLPPRFIKAETSLSLLAKSAGSRAKSAMRELFIPALPPDR